LRRIVLLFALVGALAIGVTGCGDSDSAPGGETTTEEQTATEEETSSAARALAQVKAIPALLDAAVATYKAGDHDAAADAVGDVYLEHYEDVEGPLGKRNHDLMEEIEEQISTDLRRAMRQGKPEGRIDTLVSDIKSNLEQAEQELG
jgi:hypothetical protein